MMNTTTVKEVTKVGENIETNIVNEMKVMFEKQNGQVGRVEMKLDTLSKCSKMPVIQRNFLGEDFKANSIMASLIAGIAIPACVAAVCSDEDLKAFIMYILDGQQRIGAYRRVITNDIKLDVEKFIESQGVECEELMDLLMPYNGMTFKEIKEFYPEIAERIENATVMVEIYFNPSDSKRKFLFALYNKNQTVVKNEELRKAAYVGSALYDAIKSESDKCVYSNEDTKYHVAAFVKDNLREQRTDYIAQIAFILLNTLKDFGDSMSMGKCLNQMYKQFSGDEDVANQFVREFDDVLEIIKDYDLIHVVSKAHIVKQTNSKNSSIPDGKKKLIFKILVEFVKNNKDLIKNNGDINIAEILINELNSSAYQLSNFAALNSNGTGKISAIARNAFLWKEIAERSIKAKRAGKTCRFNYNKIYEKYQKGDK